MPMKTPKEVFVALLSDLRQGAERSQKIYEELGKPADAPSDRRIRRSDCGCRCDGPSCRRHTSRKLPGRQACVCGTHETTDPRAPEGGTGRRLDPFSRL